jgi:D-alanine-D-alanine ligase
MEEDVYEKWRAAGPKTLSWDPEQVVPDVGTVQEEMSQLVGALREARFEVEVVNVEDNLERLIGALRLYRPDAVFNLVEYFLDDQIFEAYVASLYELMGVPYTGSRPITLATCQNKYRTKLLLEAAGLPTANFFLASSVPVAANHGLTFPLIVKPAAEDASGGIERASVVHDGAALEARVRYVLKEFGMPALVEEYIEGREIHAAVLGNHPPEVLPLFEMEFDDSEFNPAKEWRPQIISFRAKWDPHSTEFYSMDAVVPPRNLDPEVERRIREVSIGAFKAVRARDYARVDLRLDDRGQPFILEVNPNPDLTDGAAYMMCAAAGGRTFSQTLGAIADLAIARGRRVYRVDPNRPDLPTDHLLREFVISQRGRAGGGGAPQ